MRGNAAGALLAALKWRGTGRRWLVTMRAPEESWENITSVVNPELVSLTKDVIDGVEKMVQRGRGLDNEAYISLLTKCSEARALAQGRIIHEHVAKFGCARVNVVLLYVLRMYGSCGALLEAQKMFDSMSRRGQFEWNAMVVVYTQNGHLLQGVETLQRMPLHNTIVWNVMITAYSKEGRIDHARHVFDRLPERSVMTWNSMITQYAQNGLGREALFLFRVMELEGVRANEITFLGVLDACSDTPTARRIHWRIKGTGSETNIRVSSAIVNMYGKCGSPGEARAAFDHMKSRNRITWNGMLAAYAQNGWSREALKFYEMMKNAGMEPNRMTFLSLIDACSYLSLLDEGRRVHESIVKQGLLADSKVASSLIRMYGKCGDPQSAREVFDRSLRNDAITWTSMITAYARSGDGIEVTNLFPQMDLHGVQADKVTFISILDACCCVGNIKLGKLLHAAAVEEKLDGDVHLTSSLIGMYAKCGNLETARRLFDEMRARRTTVSWNSIIAACSQNGDPAGAVELFRTMQLAGEKPDHLTCTCVLGACSHTGRAEDARYHFVDMRENYGVELTLDHYACMVDLLGRSGKLYQAEELVENMPFEPNLAIWTSLLGACSVHRNVDLGSRVAEHVKALRPDSQCSQAMLMNVLNSAKK